MTKRAVVLIVFGLSRLGVVGQYTNMKFQSFSIPQGLSSSTCLEVVQDSEGFLWFGTIDGLNRYDGYDFEIFRPIPGDAGSISNNRINALTEDAFGNLWIGTSNGLNVYDRKKERFYRINLSSTSAQGTHVQDVINDLLYHRETNELWVATKNGLNRVKLDTSGTVFKDLSVMRYLHSENDTTSLDNHDVVSVFLRGDREVWVGTRGEHLNRYLPKRDQFKRYRYPTAKTNKLDHLPKAFLVDEDNDLWMGNDLSELFIYNMQDESHRQLQTITNSVPIFDMYQDDLGLVWVATDGFGIYVVDKRLGIVQHIQHQPYNPFSLGSNQASKVLQDQEGIFWIATYNNGVSKLVIDKAVFGHYYHVPESNHTLSRPIAQAVMEDSKGRIWIGTDGGGLNLFEEEREHFRHYQYDADNAFSLSSDKILYLEESHDGQLWVCTWDGGINLFDPETGNFQCFKHDDQNPRSLGQNTVWAAVEDTTGRLWIGTQTAGLNLYDPDGGDFYQFMNETGNESSLMSDFVFSLFIDSSNRLFAGTSIGLQVVDLKDLHGIPDQLTFTEVSKDKLSGQRVNYITEDHSGHIWVGTDLGLFELTHDLHVENNYSTLNGLPNNLIVGVKEDDTHSMWVTTKSGLSRINPATKKVNNYNVQDGLQGMEFQSKSIDKLADGRMIIGGINGFNLFEPTQIKTTDKKLKPLITSLKVFNERVKIGAQFNGRVLLKESLTNSPQIELKYDEGYVGFEFVALDYINPGRVQYAYKMEGLDQQFVSTGNSRVASYSGLPSGAYQFIVKASTDDGNWDLAESVDISVVVLPAPWKTWWAYALYELSLVLIIWAGFRYYVKRTNEERAHELDQMKLRFFMNVSHEFRTPLTLILNPVDKIISSLANPEVVQESALTIQRSARKLLSLVNQLLDFRKLDLGKAPLEPVQADIVRFSQDICQFYKELAVEKSISLEFASEMESYLLWFDPDKIEKVIGNILSNAIKFTEPKGQIRVHILLSRRRRIKGALKVRSEQEEWLEMTVTDTGVGLKKEQLKQVFDRFFHVDNTQTGTGIGLNFSKSLVEQHDGEISVESEYGVGSTFRVLLPVASERVRQAIKSQQPGAQRNVKRFDLTAMKSLEYDLAISEPEEQANDTAAIRNQTVLIVEDNVELRKHLKGELSKHFKVKEAGNGLEGLEKINKFYPDMVISDVMMPEMDGFEMCRQVKSNAEIVHIPIILLTARSLEEDRLEGYTLGADAYLPKPFNMQVLKARINNLLESKRKLRERFQQVTNILPSSELTTNSLDEQFLDKATQTILDHVGESDFGLEQLLELVGVSRSHFYRKIQSLTGQNPSHFIRSVRLKYAAELLKQSHHSIKEVSFKSGFNSTAYFSKTFKEMFQMTPNEFVQEHNHSKSS